MLTSIQGDVIRFLEPGMLEDIIAGTLDVPLTEEVLAVMAIMMLKANRWANIIIAIFFIVIDGIGFIIPRPLYENIMGIGYVVFCALIVWFAWKWTKPEE
jgi:hypothetical protein